MRSSPSDAEADVLQEARAAPAYSSEDANIEKMILMPTWREMLYDLVHSNQLDPWNIDLAEITNKYLERLKQIQTDDLRVPANLILAAAILLRFKCDLLSLKEAPAQSTLDEYIEEGVPLMEIPSLQLAGRVPPKGRVSLQELVSALEKVFSDQKKKSEEAPLIEVPSSMEIQVAEFNIDSYIQKVHGKILDLKDSEGLVTFSSLLCARTREQVIFTLLPVLFLSNKGVISMAQDPFFGEIFIRVGHPKKGGDGKKGQPVASKTA